MQFSKGEIAGQAIRSVLFPFTACGMILGSVIGMLLELTDATLVRGQDDAIVLGYAVGMSSTLGLMHYYEMWWLFPVLVGYVLAGFVFQFMRLLARHNDTQAFKPRVRSSGGGDEVVDVRHL